MKAAFGQKLSRVDLEQFSPLDEAAFALVVGEPAGSAVDASRRVTMERPALPDDFENIPFGFRHTLQGNTPCSSQRAWRMPRI